MSAAVSLSRSEGLTAGLSSDTAERLPFSQPLKLTALERRLSIGLVFGVCLIVFYLIAWNRGVSLLYGLWAIMIIALLASLLGPWLMVRPARLRLRLPANATVGEAITVELRGEQLAWPRRRTLLTLENLLPFSGSPAFLLPTLRPHENYKVTLTCTHRGVFEVNRAMVRSAYPLGILSWRRQWPVQGGIIQIAPRIWPCKRLEMLQGQVTQGDDDRRLSSRPGHEAFRDTRDYRPGDSPRHIHWRSSARHGRLIVRQYDSLAISEMLLLLNTSPAVHAGAGSRNSLEVAIELAASMAQALTRQGIRCGLVAGLRPEGGYDCWLPPGSGEGQWRRLQQALTRLDYGAEIPYASLLNSLQAHYRPGQRWVLFDHEARPLARPTFLAGGAEPLCFRFDWQSFGAGDTQASAPLLHPPKRLPNGWLISADTDLGQVFR